MSGNRFDPGSQKVLEELQPINYIGRLIPPYLVPFSKVFVKNRKERIAKIFHMSLAEQCKHYREIAFWGNK